MTMTKAAHVMIRVKDLKKSLAFYDSTLGFKLADRFDFDGFSLAYLRSKESDFEIELTHNHSQEDDYTHGDGYGHIAVVVDDLVNEHGRIEGLGVEPLAIKEFHREGRLLARFFFVQDPDGYKIEVIERHGRYQ